MNECQTELPREHPAHLADFASFKEGFMEDLSLLDASIRKSICNRNSGSQYTKQRKSLEPVVFEDAADFDFMRVPWKSVSPPRLTISERVSVDASPSTSFSKNLALMGIYTCGGVDPPHLSKAGRWVPCSRTLTFSTPSRMDWFSQWSGTSPKKWTPDRVRRAIIHRAKIRCMSTAH